MVSYRPLFTFIREKSDLPPQIPDHLLHRNPKANTRNVCIRSPENPQHREYIPNSKHDPHYRKLHPDDDNQK